MHRHLFSLLFAVGISIAATQVYAASGSGFYLGGAAGRSTVGLGEVDFNEKSIAYKAFAGYAISDIIAFEGEYLIGGKPSKDLGGGTTDVSFKGYNTSILLRARSASALSVYGKIGYAYYTLKVDDSTGVATDDSSHFAISYGGGIAYLFGKKYLTRIEYEGIHVLDGKFNAILLGVGYKF